MKLSLPLPSTRPLVGYLVLAMALALGACAQTEPPIEPLPPVSDDGPTGKF